MSFLIDPPLLVATGAVYGKAEVPKPELVAAATVGLFWGVGSALYRDRGWTRPLSKAFGSRDGQDFMINSGVLSIPYRPDDPRTHAAAVAAFATYPLWFLLGWKLARG